MKDRATVGGAVGFRIHMSQPIIVRRFRNGRNNTEDAENYQYAQIPTGLFSHIPLRRYEWVQNINILVPVYLHRTLIGINRLV